MRELLESVTPWEESTDRAAPAVLVDAWLEPLERALWSSARGVLPWRDELVTWIDEARRRAERPAWLAAWSAGAATFGSSSVACSPVNILGALLPEQLAPGFADGDSALAARFLFVWPQATTVPSLRGAPADDEGVVAMLQKIADFAGHRETPSGIALDEKATARLEELMAHVQRRMAEANGVEAEWIGKGVSTLVRLAGLLALMQWAEESEEEATVQRAHVEAAYALWSGYYLPHASGVFDRAGVGGCELAARRVVRWLRRLRAGEISREDVRRQALCQTVNAEGAEEVIARLEAGGLLRPVETRGNGRPRRRWRVNPALADPALVRQPAGGLSALSASALPPSRSAVAIGGARPPPAVSTA